MFLKKQRFCVLAAVSALILVSTFGGCRSTGNDSATLMLTVTPEVDNSPLINPGKGWIVYDAGDGNFMEVSDRCWELATVGYSRFNWSDIETADGVYDWSIVDFALNQCKNAGKTFAFGVMACDPTSVKDYCTPQFILEMDDVNALTLPVPNYNYPLPEGGYEIMVKHVVNFSNPGEGYYRKATQLAQAIRERYGDDPAIEYIDIRNFGSWGENSHGWLYGDGEDGYDKGICDNSRHDQGINYDVVKRCWQIYIDAFADTDVQLMTAWGWGCNGCGNFTAKELFAWAVEQGVGIRRDGYSTWDDCKGAEVLWSVNKAASALEMPGGYLNQAKNKGFTAEDLLASPDYNRASYYPIGANGKDSTYMVNALSDAMWKITNRIGYHFVLGKTSFSASMGLGEDGVICMDWINDGVAKLFLPSHVELALLDDNNQVVDRCTLENVDPTSFVSEMDLVTEDKANRVVSSFRFKNADPKGRYKLAVGVFTDRAKSETPDILLGNGGKTENNWYVLSDNTVQEKVVSLNASVSASSSLDGHDAEQAFLQTNGYWTAAETDETPWLLMDLGKATSFTTLQLTFGRQMSTAFTVAVSDQADGSYKTVYTAQNDRASITCTFPQQKARYIKITFTENKQQPTVCSAFVPEIGSELIENGGFEQEMLLWNGTRQESAADPVAAGGKTAYLNGYGAELKQNLIQNFELTGPGQYRLTFRAYTEENEAVIRATLNVKGSKDDQTNVQWWAPTSRDEQDADLTAGEWKTYSLDLTADYKGLTDMAALSLYLANGTAAYIDDVTLVKTSGICGERSDRYIPEEGKVTVWALSVN